MFRRKQEKQIGSQTAGRGSAKSSLAFELLEAKLAMDGCGMSLAMPLAKVLPVGTGGDGRAPVEQFSPTPSPFDSWRQTSAIEQAAEFASQNHDLAFGPSPAVDNQFYVEAAERFTPDTAGARPVAPVIPKGWDGTTPPMPGWRWKGSGPVGSNEGAWVPPEGSPRETIHPDTTPHDIGDHVDWIDIYNNKWKWVEDTGKWHPAEGNKDNRPQPVFPEGTLVPPKGGPNQIPGNEPGGTTAPTQQIPFFPFWPWPTTPAAPRPAPVPSLFPNPAFGVPLMIIPIWPKPETLNPDYDGPPLA